ncbi:DUF4124 domain-containing protein [Microbulbifer sp. ANSA001]|uniref:DUF4124 domain-containing protein n=1 Tax=Microbulbifer sp. ANSA001 TaxID=3243358 RepID=UPI00404362F7
MGFLRSFQALFLVAPLMAFAGTDGGSSSGAIYKTVGPDGRVTFSDTPPASGEAQKVELAPINVQPITLPRPLPSRKLSPKDDVEDDGGKESYAGPMSIQIVSPLDGATIPPGQRFIPLQVDVQPSYPKGASFYAVVDGQPWRGNSTGSSLDISALERGSHSVQAVLIDASGRILAQSKVITVYVQRPSVAQSDSSILRAPQSTKVSLGPSLAQSRP